MSDDLFEALAAVQHDIWSHWMRYLLGTKGRREITGDVVLRDADVQHWWRQIKTPYAELTEAEKESDREQVRKFWPLLAAEPEHAALADGTVLRDRTARDLGIANRSDEARWVPPPDPDDLLARLDCGCDPDQCHHSCRYRR